MRLMIAAIGIALFAGGCGLAQAVGDWIQSKNDCTQQNGGCDIHATCQSHGDPVCICNAGFTGDGQTCAAVPHVQLSAGGRHTCAVALDGTLTCWGANDHGQLGDGTHELRTTPVVIGKAGVWRAVSTSATRTCGVQTDGSLWCWGGTGAGPEQDILLPKPLGPERGFSEVAVGEKEACALKPDGHLRCWGVVSGAVPQDVPSEVPWRSVSVGDESICAIKTDESLWCWGSDVRGLFGGDNDPQPFRSPVKFSGNVQWSSVSVAGGHACGVQKNGSLWCWGDNLSGELGDGGHDNSLLVQPRGEATDWVSVSASRSGTCALKKDGTAWCWGHWPDDNHYEPGLVFSTERWLSLSLGFEHACAVSDTHAIQCWGLNDAGQLGNGHGARSPLPGAKVELPPVKKIAAGGASTCAISLEGELWCWGANDGGQLGIGSKAPQSRPVQVGKGKWSDVAISDAHACGVQENGTLWCWGDNSERQLGDGSITPSPSPVDVSHGMRWTGVSVEGTFSSAVEASGTFWYWGMKANTPVPLSFDGHWRTVAGGSDHRCGIDENGALWCWGNNSSGQLGRGWPSDSPNPWQLLISTPWDLTAVSGSRSCGILRDGLLRCWGANIVVGDNGSSSTPTSVVGTSGFSWKALSLGREHNCAVRTDGTLWCWGMNLSGQLGVTTVAYGTPRATQVGEATDWESVAAGAAHTCGLRQSGEVICWGSNANGELGDGSAWSTTPVPVTTK